MEMTPAVLRDLARKQGLYTTPELNDRLYLHYKGFRTLAGLEAYTGLRVLWLEGNGLTSMCGLSTLRELATLYLQENVIERIEGLENNVRLDTLNLGKNMIERLENLSHLTSLHVREDRQRTRHRPRKSLQRRYARALLPRFIFSGTPVTHAARKPCPCRSFCSIVA